MAWNNSKINLARAVHRHSIDETIVVENYEVSGMRIGGRWADPVATTSGVTASVQVASGQIKEMLPETLRIKDAIEVWSTSELRPLQREDGKPSSVVQWDGNRYTVEVLEDWYEHARYWFALCSKVDQ